MSERPNRSNPLPAVEILPARSPVGGGVQPYVAPLRALLADCVTSLFAAYGLEVIPANAPNPGAQSTNCHAAFIGFGGDQIRGALTMATALALLERTHPTSGGAPLAECDAVDWCSELLNQLVGRFKNRLLRAGAAIELSVPQGIVADRLRLAQGSRGQLVVCAYTVDDFELLLCLDAHVDETLSFEARSADTTGDIMGDGDVLFF
jgi:hypothetical protein